MGRWRQINDATGETKSVVRIFRKGGVLKDKIVKLLNEAEPGEPGRPAETSVLHAGSKMRSRKIASGWQGARSHRSPVAWQTERGGEQCRRRKRRGRPHMVPGRPTAHVASP